MRPARCLAFVTLIAHFSVDLSCTGLCAAASRILWCSPIKHRLQLEMQVSLFEDESLEETSRSSNNSPCLPTSESPSS